MKSSGYSHYNSPGLVSAHMPSFGSATPLAEMGQAGLQFVGQFELESVLGKFESELLKVTAEKSKRPQDPPPSPGE